VSHRWISFKACQFERGIAGEEKKDTHEDVRWMQGIKAKAGAYTGGQEP
jgi:hypothetical protein